MFTHYRTEGVVLSSRSIGEADIIFNVYTEAFGKISVVGRSIRKNTSKLRMKMLTFSFVEIGFVSGKSYNTLVDVETKDNFNGIRKDLAKLSFLYQLAETFFSLVVEEEKDEQIYSLLVKTIQTINKNKISSDNLKMFYCFFCFQLLYFLGHKLYITNCALCGLKIKKDGYFNAKEGGVVCFDCFDSRNLEGGQKNSKDFIYLSNVKSLQSFLKKDVDIIFKKENNVFIEVLDKYLDTIPRQKMII